MKIKFIPDNIKVTNNRFPTLKLDNKESARVVVLDAEEAEGVYVHTLRAPEIGPDGKPVMVKIERRGEMVDEYKKKFVGRHQCLGDVNIIEEGRGLDPDNCVMCEVALKSSTVDAPIRRFGVHVAKYATKPGTFDVMKPFSAQILLWIFTEGIFTKLIEFRKEHGSLLEHDLKLGPCTHADFQKFDINIASDAEWLKTATAKKYLAEAKAENWCEDVESQIAKRSERRWIDQDLKTVADAWAIANGVASDPAAAKEALEQDLSNLLGNGKSKAASKATMVPVVVEETSDPVADAEPDADERDDEPKVAPKTMSFSDMMNNL